jgi:hypothetical protein
MRDLIERFRRYSSQTRTTIAFSVALFASLLVGSAWFAGLVSSGDLAIYKSDKQDQSKEVVEQIGEGLSNTASVLSSFSKKFSQESSIEIVESTSTASFTSPAEQEPTVIPF